MKKGRPRRISDYRFVARIASKFGYRTLMDLSGYSRSRIYEIVKIVAKGGK